MLKSDFYIELWHWSLQYQQVFSPGKGRALHQPTQTWSCCPSDGHCCGFAQVHAVGGGEWQRLSEDKGDTLVKDIIIAGARGPQPMGGVTSGRDEQQSSEG